MTHNFDSILHRNYYNSEIGFQSAKALYTKLKPTNEKLTLKNVRDFIAKQNTAQVHQQVDTKDINQYNQIVSHAIGEFQMDLLDLSNFSRHNRNYRYLLLIQDIYSRFIFAEPMKNKSSIETFNAFIKIISSPLFGKKKIYSIYADAGLEFNSIIKYCETNDIKFFQKDPNIRNFGLGIIDRTCRTIRDVMKKYFTAKKTLNWIEVIQSFIKNINSTIHTTIKVKPIDVWVGLEKNQMEIREPVEKLEVGDYVRILKSKNVFEKKSSVNNYSSTIFQIKEIVGLGYILDGKDGKYFSHSLLKVPKPNDSIATRTRQGVIVTEDLQNDLTKENKIQRRLNKELN